MGNLIPLIFSAPLMVMAFQSATQFGPTRDTFKWLGLFLLVGHVSTALFGLIGNGGLKTAVGRLLHVDRPFVKEEKWFVGFASPTYKGALDPHEDLGFLILHKDNLEFFGETKRIKIKATEIERIRFKWNIHSFLLLGGWICIEGSREGQKYRLLLEPRVSWTHWANALAIGPIKERLIQWHRDALSAAPVDTELVPESDPVPEPVTEA